MRYAVKNFHKPIWETDVIGSVVFSLTPITKDPAGYAHTVGQLALLEAGQRGVIVRFLNFVSTQAADVQRPDAIKALERYWTHNAGV